MHAAAKRAGRRPDDVELLAVIKYAPAESVRELLATGRVSQVAENRVQDAQRRKSALGAAAGKARWRMIGHLQSNKAKQAVELFDSVDSLDSLPLAQSLERKLEASGRSLPALVQVKLTEKETQSGVLPAELPALLAQLAKLPHLKIEGLMGIAPDVDPVEEVRPHFKSLKRLFDQHFAGRPGARLSMGMSRDFEVAIEEGSTMVRIGTALFDESASTSETASKGGQ
jgi:PLP dependent protein